MDSFAIIQIGLAAVTIGIVAGIMTGRLSGKWLIPGFVSTFALLATCLN